MLIRAKEIYTDINLMYNGQNLKKVSAVLQFCF